MSERLPAAVMGCHPSALDLPRPAAPLPPCRGAGIALKPEHYGQVLEERPAVGWFEIHAENYMGRGGPRRELLDAIRREYPISVHGVGLSLGSAGGVDRHHLGRLKELVERYGPTLVSEHLAWSCYEGAYLGDLLPIPYTEEALRQVAANVVCAQDVLGRPILVENPSRYGALAPRDDLTEPQFLNALAAATGCGILLDVNNLVVSAHNLGFDAERYLCEIDAERVGEIHLAGHRRRTFNHVTVLIDDHGSRVPEPVWELYRRALARRGRVPTLIEWDTDVPPLAALVAEARMAETVAGEASAGEARSEEDALALAR